MDDYYDYAPRIIPERPVVLTGFAGSRTPLVGGAVYALTGLPLVDVDRWIEHESGSSVSDFVLRKGQGARGALESKLLERALDARPQGIVVLGESALLDYGNRRSVAARATLVYISLSAFELYDRILDESGRSSDKYAYLFPDGPNSPKDVQELLAERLPGYLQADLRIDASRKSPIEVARGIVSTLEL